MARRRSHRTVFMLTTRTMPNHCPSCGYVSTAASSIDGGPHKPKVGDFTICIECGAVNRFGPNLRLVASSMREAQVGVDGDTYKLLEKAANWIRKGKPDGGTTKAS